MIKEYWMPKSKPMLFSNLKEGLDYDVSGIPSTRITFYHWEIISNSDKQKINTNLTKLGYEGQLEHE